jgi:single-stranded DNA-binding protein
MYGNITFSFVGLVAKDVEIIQMANGKRKAAILCAINTPKKLESGDYEQETTWVRLAIFGERVNTPTIRNCRKGVPIYVEGVIRSYREEHGNQVFTLYNFKPSVIRIMTNMNKFKNGESKKVESESDEEDLGCFY